jgi:hypothetical protein
MIDGCNSSGLKMITSIAGANLSGGTAALRKHAFGSYSGSSTVSSVSLTTVGGTFDSGNFLVYGSA